MSGKHRTTKTFLWMIPLLVAGLACAMPGSESGGGAARPAAGRLHAHREQLLGDFEGDHMGADQ